jgi:hypothetical protein
MIEDIKSLLRRKDYITTVQQTESGCVIKYPHPKLIRGGIRLVERYAIDRGDAPGVRVLTSYMDEEQFIPVPEYAIRLFISTEMGICCAQIGISLNLIDYLDTVGVHVERLSDIIDPPTVSGDLQREGFLSKLFVEARVDNFPSEFEKVAETHNVVDGYQILQKFFKDAQ